MKKKLHIVFLVSLVACNNPDKPPVINPPANTGAPAMISYSVIKTYPHDTSSFTEGLLIYKGDLYESTGDYGRSKLLKVNLLTAETRKRIRSQ